ncbi:FAD-dependent oxidoreductase [Streptomyces sp. NPDC003860]
MSKKNSDRPLGRRSVLTGAAVVAGGAAVAAALPANARAAVGASGTGGAGGAGATSALADLVDVAPQDPRYPDLVRGTNQRWVASPEQVRLVTTPDQALRAVREAASANKRLTVRSGGHCYEDFVFNKDVQVVVDLSAMNQVYYDTQESAFVVEAGASNLQVYETLYKLYGVTIPAGSCASVGTGGHISGGGYGLLSRLMGLTVDYLHGVEVVCVDANRNAHLVKVTRNTPADTPEGARKRDLLWAHTGGGGGNFGLITRYWLRDPKAQGTNPEQALPKPPSEVLVHAAAIKWNQVTQGSFTRLVRNWGTWHEQNSAPDSPYRSLFGLLKLNHISNGQIGLITQMDATVPDARGLFDRYIQAVFAGVSAPLGAMTTRMGEHQALVQFQEPRRLPWYIATDSLSGGSPHLYGKYKSSYAKKGFSDFQIAALYKHLSNTAYQNGDALVQVDSYGGQINTVKSADTAVPQRDSVLKLQFQTYWTDPTTEAGHVQWIRELYRDMYAETGGVPVPGPVNDGCYINYPDKDLGDRAWNTSTTSWQSLYYAGNYPRLQQAKKAWDPTNFFHHAQSIRLP